MSTFHDTVIKDAEGNIHFPRTDADSVRTGDGSQTVEQRLDTVDTQLTALNTSLTAPTVGQFIYDYQNGKPGVNTSPTRGADTFVPFGKKLIPLIPQLTADSSRVISSGDGGGTSKWWAFGNIQNRWMAIGNGPGLYIGYIFDALTEVSRIEFWKTNLRSYKIQITYDGTTWIDETGELFAPNPANYTDFCLILYDFSISKKIKGFKITTVAYVDVNPASIYKIVVY